MTGPPEDGLMHSERGQPWNLGRSGGPDRTGTGELGTGAAAGPDRAGAEHVGVEWSSRTPAGPPGLSPRPLSGEPGELAPGGGGGSEPAGITPAFGEAPPGQPLRPRGLRAGDQPGRGELPRRRPRPPDRMAVRLPRPLPAPSRSGSRFWIVSTRDCPQEMGTDPWPCLKVRHFDAAGTRRGRPERAARPGGRPAGLHPGPGEPNHPRHRPGRAALDP